MNITRDNYEEFFMLYADNELSQEQRSAVEAFVEANPDLKPDLDLYFSLKLDTDQSISLGDKSFLLRREAVVPETVQTAMLLHLDGELPAAEATSLEARIQEDESLRHEWELLNRAKLHPDPDVRFPEKQVLYRHATGGARVLRIRWVRYAAAAAVILFAGLLWLNNPDSDGRQPGSVSLAGTDSGDFRPVTDDREGGSGETIADAGTEPVPTPAATGNNDQEGVQVATVASDRPQIAALTAKTLPVEKGEQRTKPETVSPAVVVVKPAFPETKGELLQDMVQVNTGAGRVAQDITDQPAGMEGVKTDYATQALAMQAGGREEFTETVYSEKDRERKGFRGLVRKANRIFHKVTNPDLDRPVVKVANVEIGLGR
jgi:hypothetical protein